MRNRCEMEVNSEVFTKSNLTDEIIFRDLAKKMVSGMPYDELCKLIKFSKLDPNSKKASDVLWSDATPKHEKDRIMLMRERLVILYEAECNLEW